MIASAPLSRRTLLLSGAASALLPAAALRAETNYPSATMAETLPTMQVAHPRLLITDAQMAACRERAKSDPVYRQMVDRIIREARTILAEPTVPYAMAGTSRPSILGGARIMIRRVINTAFAWRWTGERAFADRVRQEILSAARFPEWHHAHFLDVAEIAFAVSIGYDWIHAALSPEDRMTVRLALVDKGLLWADRAYRGTADTSLKYPTFTWNWNQVCNGGMLAAAIAVAEDEPQLAADIIAGVQRSLPLALAALGPDGAGSEGPIYWTYGLTFHVLILATFRTATGTDHGLGDTDAFRETDIYRLWVQGPTGKAFNYADCKELLSPTSALAWFGEQHRHPRVTALARREMIDRFNRPLLDAEFDRFYALYPIWYPAAAPVPAMQARAKHFRGNADIAIFRGDWDDRNAAYLGFKAGNTATNHGHLDLGSFVLEGQGVRWAIDLGADSYQIPGYFDDEANSSGRFRIFRVQTSGHGTFMPEGVEQDIAAVGPITRFVERGDGGLAIADLTAAYPNAARRLRRGIDFIGNGKRVVVRDELEGAAPGARWRWAMLTEANVAIEGARATLTLEGRTMVAVIDTPGYRFATSPATPPTARENQNAGVSMLTIAATADAAGNAMVQVSLYPLGGSATGGAEVPLDRWQAATDRI